MSSHAEHTAEYPKMVEPIPDRTTGDLYRWLNELEEDKNHCLGSQLKAPEFPTILYGICDIGLLLDGKDCLFQDDNDSWLNEPHVKAQTRKRGLEEYNLTEAEIRASRTEE